jgi:hypothetical protein
MHYATTAAGGVPRCCSGACLYRFEYAAESRKILLFQRILKQNPIQMSQDDMRRLLDATTSISRPSGSGRVSSNAWRQVTHLSLTWLGQGQGPLELVGLVLDDFHAKCQVSEP